jgi:hypothetical protein
MVGFPPLRSFKDMSLLFKVQFWFHVLTTRPCHSEAAIAAEAIPLSVRRLLRYARNDRMQRVLHSLW